MSIQINCNVSGQVTNSPELVHDSGKIYPFIFDPFSSIRGHFTLADGSPANGYSLNWSTKSVRVWLSVNGHEPLPPGSYELNLLKDDAGNAMPAVLDYPPLLEQPVVQGIEFATSKGRWVLKAATNYLAVGRWLLSQNTPIFSGSNTQAVLGTCKNIPRQVGIPDVTPENFPQIYNAIHDFGVWLNTQGQLLYLICLADANNDSGWNKNFVANCVNAMQGVLGFFSIGNEFYNNGFDPKQWSRSEFNLNMPVCRGSVNDEAGSKGYDAFDHWDFIDAHIRRDYPKMIDHYSLIEMQDKYKKPIFPGEGPKANDVDEPNRSYTNSFYFYQGGRISSAVNGGVFHSECGVLSQPLTPIQDACRSEFYRGMN